METIITENLQKTQRYIPHTLETRLAAVKTYRNKNSISFICRRYKVSKASLMRWNKKYDGTIESLMDKSHRPHSQLRYLFLTFFCLASFTNVHIK